MNLIRSKRFTLFSVALLAACGGTPTDNGGNGNGDTRTIKTNPLFGADIQGIFTRTGCTTSGCHGAAG